MESSNGVLWLIFWALVFIGFRVDQPKMLQTETMYPVACRLSGPPKHRQCA
jgi:hypothetical protein